MERWVEEGLDSIDLGDARLNERSKEILGAFFGKHSASINSSFKGWPEVKAAYRFFDNDNVSSDQILHPHYQASVRRIEKEEIILCVQDTTILNYSHRKQLVLVIYIIPKIKDCYYILLLLLTRAGFVLACLIIKALLEMNYRGRKQGA